MVWRSVLRRVIFLSGYIAAPSLSFANASSYITIQTIYIDKGTLA